MKVETRWIPLLIVTLAAALWTSAFQTPALQASDRWQILEPDEAELHRNLWQQTEERWSYRLDLADPGQYAYVLHMLELGGESAEQSPGLYQALAEAHAEREVREARAPSFDAADASSGSGTLVPLNDIAYFRPKTQQEKNYEGEGLSSYPGGTVVSHMVINLTAQENAGPTIFAKNAAAAKTYLQGENFRVAVDGAVPASITSSNIQANILYLVQWKTNCPTPGDPACKLQAVQSHQQLSSLSNTGCLQQPIYKQYQSTTKCTNQLGSTVLNNALNLCWYRTPGNEGTCDYWNPSGRPATFDVPIKGSASFGNAIDSVDFMDLTFQRTTGGGGCKICGYNPANSSKCPSGAGTVNVSQVNVSGSSMTWDWTGTNIAKFPNSANCITPGVDPVWFNLEMWVTLDNGNFSQVQFATLQPDAPAAPEYPMPAFNIYNGCLEEDAQILLADGESVVISSLLDAGGGSPSVLSDRGAKASRGLDATSRGFETIPMVRLTAGEYSLLLTEWHPVILADGTAVAAQHVQLGDAVQTLTGPQAVVHTGREVYERQVYNLKLQGTPEEVASGHTTFYANGIRVGDMEMQSYVEAEAKRRLQLTPEQTREALPERWRQDYDNHLRALPRAPETGCKCRSRKCRKH